MANRPTGKPNSDSSRLARSNSAITTKQQPFQSIVVSSARCGDGLVLPVLDRPQHQRDIERLTDGLATALQAKGDRLLWQLIRLVHEIRLTVFNTTKPPFF